MFPSSGAIFKSTAIMTMSISELSKSLTVKLIVVKCEDRQIDGQTSRRTDRQSELCMVMLHRLFRKKSTGEKIKNHILYDDHRLLVL